MTHYTFGVLFDSDAAGHLNVMLTKEISKMFAFIDESGHTGENLRDEVQPVFHYLAIISKYNIDVLAKKRIVGLCTESNIERIHASELGRNNETFAGPLLSILKKFSPHFIIAEVEKNFLALAKLFDTLFDAGENLGARDHVYNFRALRLLLLYNFSRIVDEELAFDFYDNCLFAETQSQANTKLIEVCQIINGRLTGQFDQRTEELISDTLKWAIKNPDAITTYNASKEQRWRHLPNVVAFIPTLQVLANLAKEQKTRVRKIVHDEQIQMKKILTEAHSFSSNINFPDSLKFADNPIMLFKQLKGSEFEITSSKTNVGLQLVDFVLYNWRKKDYILSNREENIDSFELFHYYSQRMDFFEFSHNQLEQECISIIKRLSTMQLTDEQLNQGKELINSMEIKYHERIKDM